jgi:hypothetical protein
MSAKGKWIVSTSYRSVDGTGEYPAGCIFEGGTEVESTTVYGKDAFD